MNHPDWEYRIGDIVFFISEENKQSTFPYIGQILNIKNGKIQVLWSDKTISWNKPNQLIKFNDEEDDISTFSETIEFIQSEDEEEDDFENDDYSDNEIQQPGYIQRSDTNNAWWLESEADSYNFSMYNKKNNLIPTNDLKNEFISNDNDNNKNIQNNNNHYQNNNLYFSCFEIVEEFNNHHFQNEVIFLIHYIKKLIIKFSHQITFLN